jgi:hypothetical protein
LPDASFAAVVIVTAYCVLAARLLDGTNIAVLPLTTTVPLTAAPPLIASRMLEAVRVDLVIASEKVAETEALTATPVAAFAGDVAETLGGVVSRDKEPLWIEGAVLAGSSAPPLPPPPPQPARPSKASIPARNSLAKILEPIRVLEPIGDLEPMSSRYGGSQFGVEIGLVPEENDVPPIAVQGRAGRAM